MKKRKIIEVRKKSEKDNNYSCDIINTDTHKQISLWE